MNGPREKARTGNRSAAFPQGGFIFFLLSRNESDGRKQHRTNVHLLPRKSISGNKIPVNSSRSKKCRVPPLSTTYGTVNRNLKRFWSVCVNSRAIFVLFFREIQANRKRQTSGAAQVFVRIPRFITSRRIQRKVTGNEITAAIRTTAVFFV